MLSNLDAPTMHKGHRPYKWRRHVSFVVSPLQTMCRSLLLSCTIKLRSCIVNAARSSCLRRWASTSLLATMSVCHTFAPGPKKHPSPCNGINAWYSGIHAKKKIIWNFHCFCLKAMPWMLEHFFNVMCSTASFARWAPLHSFNCAGRRF